MSPDLRRSTPLDWGALAAAFMLFGWGFTAFAGFLLPLSIGAGIAAFVLFFVALRRHAGPARHALGTGSALGLAVIVAWALSFLVSLPVKFGRDPDTGRVSEGSGAVNEFASGVLGPWLPIITVVAVLIALFPFWNRRERILGVAGSAGAAAVLIVTPLIESPSDAVGPLLLWTFILGFVAVIAACLLPVFLPQDDARWPRPGTPPPQPK